jgi:hypothetical protein
MFHGAAFNFPRWGASRYRVNYLDARTQDDSMQLEVTYTHVKSDNHMHVKYFEVFTWLPTIKTSWGKLTRFTNDKAETYAFLENNWTKCCKIAL